MRSIWVNAQKCAFFSNSWKEFHRHLSIFAEKIQRHIEFSTQTAFFKRLKFWKWFYQPIQSSYDWRLVRSISQSEEQETSHRCLLRKNIHSQVVQILNKFSGVCLRKIQIKVSTCLQQSEKNINSSHFWCVLVSHDQINRQRQRVWTTNLLVGFCCSRIKVNGHLSSTVLEKKRIFVWSGKSPLEFSNFEFWGPRSFLEYSRFRGNFCGFTKNWQINCKCSSSKGSVREYYSMCNIRPYQL